MKLALTSQCGKPRLDFRAIGLCKKNLKLLMAILKVFAKLSFNRILIASVNVSIDSRTIN